MPPRARERRKSRRTPGRISNCITLRPFGAEDAHKGVEVVDETRRLITQIRPARARQAVVARTAAVLRDAPLGAEELALLETAEGLEERGVVDGDAAVGTLLDPRRDLERVHRRPGEGLEHEHVECTLE